eukprot:TRINITY_DN93960_c0_g1_i1.p1 TRINITY_DN93960_c0_g1~~TRINITY_DN93960_c0_g1_i1.p1  ORF type:complete len:250 (-),score=80.13 TRINITY_DN93960_c0_g1_i1:53-802(-)
MMSSTTDPYYVAKDDVQSAIKETQKMHKEWKKLLDSENTAKSRAFQELHANLAGELRQLDFDLKDITATISMVEGNRSRFQIDDAEIGRRKAFVQESRAAVQAIQNDVTSPGTTAKIENDKRQLLARQEQDRRGNEDSRRQVERENDAFLQRQRQEQAQIIRQQDDALEELGKSAQRLNQVATTINIELQDQQKMLKELDDDIERETEKLNFVMKRMGKLLKTSDNKQLCLIIALFVLALVLLFLVINT